MWAGAEGGGGTGILTDGEADDLVVVRGLRLLHRLHEGPGTGVGLERRDDGLRPGPPCPAPSS